MFYKQSFQYNNTIIQNKTVLKKENSKYEQILNENISNIINEVKSYDTNINNKGM